MQRVNKKIAVTHQVDIVPVTPGFQNMLIFISFPYPETENNNINFM